MKKVLFIAAIVGAVGFGAMLGPVASLADDTFTPPYQQVQKFMNQDGDRPFGAGARMGQYFSGKMHEEIAAALGISAGELYDARQDGKSLEEIAQENDVKAEELKTLLLDTKKQQVNQLLEEGKITQEQASYMIQRMEENVDAAMTRTEAGPMNGNGRKGGGPGQGKGFGGGGPRWSNN